MRRPMPSLRNFNLNQKMAKREYSKLALQNFRAALASDPSNVQANAMQGNWMLQNEGE